MRVKVGQCLIIISSFILMACAAQRNHASFAQAKLAFQQQQYTKAIDKLTSVALDGNSQAQYALGYMYYYGKGVRADKDLARAWFIKAAASGSHKAEQALKMIDETTPNKKPLQMINKSAK